MFSARKCIPLFICALLISPARAFSFDDGSGFSGELSEDDIANYRATSGNVNMQINMSDNVSDNSTTGDNNISDSAFTQANGLINIIQNSGNNVAIQTSTDVTVTIN